MPMEITGLESTLKALNKIQPDIKKQFFKDARNILKPVIEEAKLMYPSETKTKGDGGFPSGLSRNWAPGGRRLFPYSQALATSGIKIETSLSKKKDAVLTIVQKDGAASVIDYAGTKTPNALGRALNGMATKPRVMWRAYENNAGKIESELEASVNEVMKRISAFDKLVLL